MDEPGAHAWNLVGGDGRADAAAAERHAALEPPCGDRRGQGGDEVGIVIRGVQLMYPEPRKDSATSRFKANPPWSAAIPTRIMAVPPIGVAICLLADTFAERVSAMAPVRNIAMAGNRCPFIHTSFKF